VALLDLHRDATDAAAREIGGLALVADVRDAAAVDAACAEAASAFGGLTRVPQRRNRRRCTSTRPPTSSARRVNSGVYHGRARGRGTCAGGSGDRHQCLVQRIHPTRGEAPQRGGGRTAPASAALSTAHDPRTASRPA
jgi:hypothetical protein